LGCFRAACLCPWLGVIRRGISKSGFVCVMRDKSGEGFVGEACLCPAVLGVIRGILCPVKRSCLCPA